MQTFLPYTEFFLVGKTLDTKRLGKQRVEAKQILNALEPDTTSRWRNHVAVRMWRGYEDCLKFYANWIIREWTMRGYENNMPYFELEDPENFSIPDWLYDERLALSHRCNLVRKLPEYYNEFKWPKVDPDAPYWWPVPLKTPAKQKEMVDYWGE